MGYDRYFLIGGTKIHDFNLAEKQKNIMKTFDILAKDKQNQWFGKQTGYILSEINKKTCTWDDPGSLPVTWERVRDGTVTIYDYAHKELFILDNAFKLINFY